jgi:hypothetical protein
MTSALKYIQAPMRYLLKTITLAQVRWWEREKSSVKSPFLWTTFVFFPYIIPATTFGSNFLRPRRGPFITHPRRRHNAPCRLSVGGRGK